MSIPPLIRLLAAGVMPLTRIDVACFAVYCAAYSRWRTVTERIAAMAERDPLTHGLLIKTQAGDAAANPLVYIANHAARDMVRYAGEFRRQ
jgi:phage terminase small subunit